MKKLISSVALAVAIMFTGVALAQTPVFCTQYRISSLKEHQMFYRLVNFPNFPNPIMQFITIEKGMSGTVGGLRREGTVQYFTNVKWDAALLPGTCVTSTGALLSPCDGNFVFDVPVEAKVLRTDATALSCE